MAEVYVGTKFDTRFVDREPVPASCTTPLIACGARFARLGLTPENAGFVAVRSTEGMVIKTAGASLANMMPQTFAEVLGYDRADGARPQVLARGPSEPSSETGMAWRILAAFPRAHALVHVHAPAPRASSGEATAPPVPGLACTDEEHDYGTPALADAAVNALHATDHAHTVWLRDHGYVTVGRDLAQAECRFLALLAALALIEDEVAQRHMEEALAPGLSA